MNKPRIDALLEKVDSKYALVTIAAKRARQINNYYRNREEGSIDDIPPPLLDTTKQEHPHHRTRRDRCGQDLLPLSRLIVAFPVR